MVDAAVAAVVAAATASTTQQIRQEPQVAITRMVEQMVPTWHRHFGVSSEQLAGQAQLFDEAEVLAQPSTAEQDLATLSPPALPPTNSAPPAKRPAGGKRRALSTELERVDVIHDVPESQRTCPCGTPMVEIGCHISEQLDIVPMQVRVLRHVRKRYGCAGSLHAPVTAALPPLSPPKSNASVDLPAMLLVVKFIDGLPLARFEYVLGRHGVAVPRQTLARWVIGASRLLQPLHNLLRDHLTDGLFIHMDETVVQVLKEDGKAPTSTSYM